MIKSTSTQIIAHRGASADAPENTLEAFQLGLDQGADAIECDIHLSKDGKPVVLHDPTLERTTGTKEAVSTLTLSELKTLDAGSWKAAKWNGARIPTLAETLDLVPEDRRIFIEVKVGFTALPQLEAVLDASRLARSQLVLMEFDLETVIRMRVAFPDIETLWLNQFPLLSPPWQRARMIEKNIERVIKQGFDGINLQNVRSLNADVIQSCHANGLKCYCWTVDHPSRAAALLKGGIDGIATNRPGWMRDQLGLDRSDQQS